MRSPYYPFLEERAILGVIDRCGGWCGQNTSRTIKYTKTRLESRMKTCNPPLVYFMVDFQPEWIQHRFGGRRIRMTISIISLMLYCFTKISVTLYAGGQPPIQYSRRPYSIADLSSSVKQYQAVSSSVKQCQSVSTLLHRSTFSILHGIVIPDVRCSHRLRVLSVYFTIHVSMRQ